jgi:hypothetical protein
VGLVREWLRIRIGLHSSSDHSLGLGIPGCILPGCPSLCGELLGGLEIFLKRKSICGKV